MKIHSQVLELHRNQNGIHLQLDEPHSGDEKRDSSDSEVRTVVRSRNSSISEEQIVIENVPKESKLTKSDKKSRKSDINANTRRSSRTSDTEGEGEPRDDGFDDVEKVENSYNDRLGNDFTDSGNAPQSYSRDIRHSASSPTDNIDNRKYSSDRVQNEISEKDQKRPRLSSGNADLEPEDEAILKQEFEKLRSFAREVVPRPLYEEAKYVEEIEEEPIEENMEYVTVDHEEPQEEFSTRFFTYDKVHDMDSRGLPDFSDLDYEYHDIGFNEVDPDLLSMNLAPILEETEEELAEEEENEAEDNEEMEQDWRGNWMFKGTVYL